MSSGRSNRSKSVPWWDSAYEDPMIVGTMFGWKKQGADLEVDAILRKVRLKPGSRILDLACGAGRHSLEFSRRGYQVVGLDYSDLLLRKAKAAARKVPQNLRPQFVHGDMREVGALLPKASFDLVLSLWNAWGYFDDPRDDFRVLSGISRVLKPGGRVLINTLNLGGVKHAVRGGARRRWLEEGKDRIFLDEFAYDSKSRKAHAGWYWVSRKKGLLKQLQFQQNVYSPEDFGKQFKRVGIKTENLWGLLDGSPYTETSWHQTIVGRKTQDIR